MKPLDGPRHTPPDQHILRWLIIQHPVRRFLIKNAAVPHIPIAPPTPIMRLHPMQLYETYLELRKLCRSLVPYPRYRRHNTKIFMHSVRRRAQTKHSKLTLRPIIALIVIFSISVICASSVKAQFLFRVDYTDFGRCDSPEPRASPLEACRVAWPGAERYEIWPDGGQGTLTGEPPNNDEPYVDGPACVAFYKGIRPGTFDRLVVGLCSYSNVDIGRNLGNRCDLMAGNPINIALGNKHHEEHLIPHWAIEFRLLYNSISGAEWRHTLSRKLTFSSFHPDRVHAVRDDESTLSFTKSGSRWLADAGTAGALTELTDNAGQLVGWHLSLAYDNSLERYNRTGQLMEVTYRPSVKITISHDTEGRAKTMTDHRGRSVTLSFKQNGMLDIVTGPGGEEYRLGYENGNLTSVTYPGAHARFFHYEDHRYPYALTGITDENGERFATWTYDDHGRASSSERAHGSQRTTLNYNPDGSTTVTNALGREATHYFDVKQGSLKISRVEGNATTTCNGSNQVYEYDANGYLASKTDWNGFTTTYVRDDLGRELVRTESPGTPEQRTFITEWHPQLGLPTRFTEPGKTTTFTYNNDGRLLNRSESSAP